MKIREIVTEKQLPRFIVLLALLLTSILPSLAQSLRGRIVDSRTDEPIVGAIVSVKGDIGSKVGAVSDIDGNFTLDIKKAPAVIVVSFTGYKREEIDIYELTDDVLPVSLTEDFNALEGVVVIGYGTQKKADLAGSVTSVNVGELNKSTSASLNGLLNGTTPGLQATPTGGQPGAGISIRIRGGSSVQGGNEPLYVIDGFPIYNESITSGTFSDVNANIDPLSTINPGDIESITVLKDASATAIYGSRGANGVVIITTKKGSYGDKAQVAYSASVGFQKLRKKYDVLNATEFAQLKNDAMYDIDPSGGKYQYKSAEEVAALGTGTDWQDLAYRTAVVTNHQLSISGGSEKTRYSVSGNYFNQDGILRNTGFNRLSTRVNLDSKISDRFTVGFNLTASKTKSKVSPTSTTFAILQEPATATAYEEDGSYTYDPGFETAVRNPIASLDLETNKSRSYKLLGTAFGEYEVIKNLKLKVLFGTDVDNTKDYHYVPSSLYEGVSNGGSATIGVVDQSSWLNENTLTYGFDINKKHHFDVLAGFTQQESKTEIVRANSYNYVSDFYEYNSLQSGAVAGQPYSYSATHSLLSLLARANYNFDQRYYVSASIRRDGSSRFGKDKKWGTFPSIGLSWSATNESFFKPYKRLFSNFKVRASYGVTGNQEIGNYQSLSTLSSTHYIFGNQLVVGYVPDRIQNDDLGWETTKQFDLGVDVSFLKDRLNFTADYYYKKTTDLLLEVAIPYTTGHDVSLQNYGSVGNRGFEFAVNSKNFIGQFKWNTSANISFNRNKILSIGGTSDSYITTSYYWAYILKVGQPLGTFYGAVYDGVLQEGEEETKGNYTYNQTAKAGDRLFKDFNDDGKFSNADDRTIIGNAQPDFTFGISNSFEYKGFDLNFLINGSVGNDIANINKVRLSLYSGLQNAVGEARNHWTSDNPSSTISRAKSEGATVFSTEYIEDGSFVRLKNITLGYTFPTNWVKSIGLSYLRLYASATNLWTITNYSGYDPEVTSADNALTAGTDYGAYPSAKTFNFGVEIKF